MIVGQSVSLSCCQTPIWAKTGFLLLLDSFDFDVERRL
jgi:hypothetical protein